MSRPIDEKIVKMSMDNKDFETKANRTISIFAKLQDKFKSAKNLNLSGSTKSVNDLGTATNKVSLKGLISGVGEVGQRFSAMSVIAIGALMKIGETAVTAGARMLKSFTLEPITSGFAEYEEKMNAIQVILSNTEGKSNLDDVKASLADLNTYADLTIYSFADMTKNMGTFTAAGVGLETAQTAIKGIGNLAAVSGSNTQQAGTAMYQLSQAIAAGKVGLQDWNSVVNAGMGGAKFQNALKANAKGFWDSADATLSFRDSLQEGWLTTEVLMTTLQQFAEDQSMLEAATKVRTFSQLVDTAREALQSGWATTWELIFGDFKESGDMWTQVGEAILNPIAASADARNKLLQDFVTLGGRAALIDVVKNAFLGLTSVIGIAKSAFQTVFPPATAQQLTDLAKRLAEFSKGFILSGESANKAKSIFTGLFSVFSIAITVVKRVSAAIREVIPEGIVGRVVDFMVAIANMVTGFDKSLKAGNKFTKGLDGIVKGLAGIIDGIWNFGSTLAGALASLVGGFGEVIAFIGPGVQKVGDFISKFLGTLDINDALNAGFIVTITQAMKKFSKLGDTIGGFFDSFTDTFDVAKDAIKNLGGLTDALDAMTKTLRIGQLVAIAASVTLLAVSMNLLANIPAQDIFKGLEVIGASLVGMIVAMKQIAKIPFDGAGKATAVLIGLGVAIVAMSAGLKIISSINPDELAGSFLALAGTVATLTAAVIALGKFSGKMQTGAGSIVVLSTAIVILAGAMKLLSTIDNGDIVKSVVSLAAIFASLAGFLRVVNGVKFGPAQASGVLVTAGAILVMVGGIKMIASIPVGDIVKGLATIGALLIEMGVFVKLTSGAKTMGAAVGIIAIAGAINMMVGPIQSLGKMSLSQLAQGLIAMGAALGIVVAAMQLAKGAGGGAASIVAMAAAIAIFVPPLLALSKLSLKQVGVGLLALAGAFAVIGGAAALIAPLSPAILALSLAVAALGLSMAGVGLALVGFTTAITSLAAIGATGIAAFTGALGLLLMSLTALIPEMVKFAVTAVTEMAAGLAKAAPALWQSGLEMVLGLLTALEANVPQIITVGIQFVIALAQALGDNVGQLIDAGIQLIVDLVNGMADGLRENQGQLVAAMMNIIEAMLEALVTGLQAILDVMLGWIPGFSDVTSGLGDAAREALRGVFNSDNIAAIGNDGASGFVSGVNSKSGDANTAGTTVGESARAGVDSKTGDFTPVGANAGSLYTNALGSKAGIARSTGTNVANNAKSGAGSVSLNPEGSNAGSAYAGGLGGKAGAARNSGSSVGNAGKSGAGSVNLNSTGSSAGSAYGSGLGGKAGAARSAGASLGNSAKSGASVDLSGEGSNAGSGFVNALSGWAGRAASAAASIANAAKSAIAKAMDSHSPSRETFKLGTYGGQGFALGFHDQERNVERSARTMAEVALDTVASYGQMIADAMNGDMSLQPVITPVLDMSNINIPDLSTRVPFLAAINGNDDKVVPNISISVTAPSSDPTAIANEVEKIIVRRIQS